MGKSKGKKIIYLQFPFIQNNSIKERKKKRKMENKETKWGMKNTELSK